MFTCHLGKETEHMSWYGNCKQLNRFQRRSLRLFAITLLATAGLFIADRVVFDLGHLSNTWLPVLSVLTAVPFVAMMLMIPRYLRQEKDEFMRTLMLRAMLWGFAVPMVVDTVWGFLWGVWPTHALRPMLSMMPMLNIDLFCVAALLAFYLQRRSYE